MGTGSNETILTQKARQGDLEAVRSVLKSGISPNAMDSEGNRALIEAVARIVSRAYL